MAMTRTPLVDDDGTGTTGTVLNNAWYQNFCNAIDAYGANPPSPPVARTDVANTFGVAPQTISAASPAIHLIETGQPANSRLFRLIGAGAVLNCQALNDAASTILATPLSMDRTGNVRVGADLYEKGRTTPMGHWIDVPFSAANFTSDVGTWVVDSADQITNAYTVIGKTMLWSLFINTSTVTGTPSGLKVALPAGLTIARGFTGLLGVSNDGVVNMVNITAFVVQFGRVPTAAFTNTTNGTFVGGTFPIPIV